MCMPDSYPNRKQDQYEWKQYEKEQSLKRMLYSFYDDGEYDTSLHRGEIEALVEEMGEPDNTDELLQETIDLLEDALSDADWYDTHGIVEKIDFLKGLMFSEPQEKTEEVAA